MCIKQPFLYWQHETNNLNDGYLGSGQILKQAIIKHGKHAFKREILMICKNKDHMNQMEAKFVTEDTISNPLCYNLSPGGQGGYLGEEARIKSKGQWTEERRLLQSALMKKQLENGLREKAIAANTGRRNSDDALARQKLYWTQEKKLEQSNKMKILRCRKDVIDKLNAIAKIPKSAETRAKLSNASKGRKLSTETKIKISTSNIGKKRSDETKKNISLGNLGKIRSEEAKLRMSDSAKNRENQAWTGKKRPTKECPHCSKIGADYLMTRWHFDNCKSLRK